MEISLNTSESMRFNAFQLTLGKYAPSDENYADDGKLKNITVDTGSYLYHTGIEYDIDVNRKELSRIKYYINNGAATGYSYDVKGNITDIQLPDGKKIHYEYDSLNQLIREVNEQTLETIDYSYDERGNIAWKNINYSLQGGSYPADKRISYTYGNSIWKDRMTYYNGFYVSYDTIGNPTSYNGWAFGWEGGRQLKTLAKTGTSMSFKYNDEGIRTAKTVNGVETKYQVTDGVIRSLSKGSDTVSFNYSGDSLISMVYNGTEYWYIRNAQNDVIGLFDAGGNTVVQYIYNSWGMPVSTTGTKASTVGAINPFRYRGYVYDTESGLYYLQSRYYNPEWGRFVNGDGYTSTGQGFNGSNMYAYCGNNPVMRADPSGRLWGIIAAIVVAVVVIAVTAYVVTSTPNTKTFDTIEEATSDWAETYKPKSEKKEKGAILYKTKDKKTKETKYTYGRTYKGHSTNTIPGFLIGYVSGGISAIVSKNKEMIGFIHSHPAVGVEDHNDFPSKPDRFLLNFPGINEVYVVPYEKCDGTPDIIRTTDVTTWDYPEHRLGKMGAH